MSLSSPISSWMDIWKYKMSFCDFFNPPYGFDYLTLLTGAPAGRYIHYWNWSNLFVTHNTTPANRPNQPMKRIDCRASSTHPGAENAAWKPATSRSIRDSRNKKRQARKRQVHPSTPRLACNGNQAKQQRTATTALRCRVPYVGT